MYDEIKVIYNINILVFFVFNIQAMYVLSNLFLTHLTL